MKRHTTTVREKKVILERKEFYFSCFRKATRVGTEGRSVLWEIGIECKKSEAVKEKSIFPGVNVYVDIA